MLTKIFGAENLHIYISYLLFIASLSTIAFYADDFGNGYWSIFVLLLGWLGIFIGAFQWLANIFFIIALSERNNLISSVIYSVIAVSIGLSFCILEPPMTFGGPYQPIVGYGLGYGLWLASMSIFLVGQILLLLKVNTSRIKYYLLFFIFFFIAVISFEYFYGKNSPYQFNKNQNDIMEKYCKQSKIKIFHKVNNVESIYFAKDKNGLKFNNFGFEWSADKGIGFVNLGYIKYYEYLQNGKYHKVYADPTNNYKIKDINITSPKSSILVTITSKTDKKYAIHAQEIKIEDTRNNRVLGEAFFAVETLGSTYTHCPAQGFATDDFIKNVLNLKDNSYKNYRYH